MMDDALWHRLAARANADGEFRLAARFWTATLRFDVGERCTALRIEDGVVRTVAACKPDDPSDARVAAPAEEWQRLLAAEPRPFYQDLFGATASHGFVMDGDPIAVYPYYAALRRLIELARQTVEA